MFIISDDNAVIKEFEISTRINEGLTSFNITFATPLEPTEYVTGSTFEFVIDDISIDGEFLALNGIVEGVDRKIKDNNRIYSISGRDKGRLLLKQPFSLDCDNTNPTLKTVDEIIDLILTDTGITVGRGQTSLNKIITLTNDGTQSQRYCGEWSNKQEALNQLFAQYVRFSGASKFRWYIDYAGYFRWFEINTNRAAKIYYFEDNENIIDAQIKEDGTNIQNYFVGFYGQEEDGTSVVVSDATSITKYGKCIAPTTTKTDMTEAEITADLTKQLNQRKDPIYSGSIELDDFYHIEPGTQIIFPNDAYYSSVTFTVTDVKWNGTPSKPRTTLNVTSDESSISIANEFEVIQATAQNEVENAKPVVGVVTEIGTTGDRCNVFVTGGGGGGTGSVVSVRNVGGNFRTG